MRPYFTISARPLLNSRVVECFEKGQVDEHGLRLMECTRRFLPPSRSIPVFPPMALSTWATQRRRHLQVRDARMYMEATKPVISRRRRLPGR